jgi:hypothetical protein
MRKNKKRSAFNLQAMREVQRAYPPISQESRHLPPKLFKMRMKGAADKCMLKFRSSTDEDNEREVIFYAQLNRKDQYNMSK